MPVVSQFEYVKPQSEKEAVEILSRNKNAAILSGGTDLVGAIKEGTRVPELVVDIKGLPLKQILFENNKLWIGALTTFTDLIESEIIAGHFPVIKEVAQKVASMGIRNRATMVGNVCSAVPCMDSGPLLAAYDAEVVVVGSRGERSIPSADWFVFSRKTAMQPGEFVKGITLPLPEGKHAGCFVKLGRYQGEDLAQVNLVVLALEDGTFRIAFGSVAPVPVRARSIENLLAGKQPDAELLEQAVKLLAEEIAPIADIRASKEYRSHMAEVMLARGIKAALDRLHGSGPAYGTSVI